MEPSSNKRSKLISIMFFAMLLVLCGSKAYAKEPEDNNTNKQQETTQQARNLELWETEQSLLNTYGIEELDLEMPYSSKLDEQHKIPEVIGNKFLERAEAMEYTEEELELLARVMYAEAGMCDDKELYRVANVVLNRVNDDSRNFANTIKGVIYQEGQFTSVGGKQWNIGPTEREMKIAKDVLEGARILPSNTYWFSKGHRYGDLIYESDWHCFSGMDL